MRKLLVFGLLALLGCCGYTTRAMLPGYLKTIYIEQVQNRTLRPLLGEQLTDQLITEFTRNGRLRVASEPSTDLLLEVEVTSYRRTAAVYETSSDVPQWRYEIKLSATCTDQVKNTVLWDGAETVFEVVDEGVPEDEVIQTLIERASEVIVRDVLLAW